MKTRSLWISFSLFILFASVLLVVRVYADDVYNFYFQKAPGPTSVYQGGGSSPANVSQTPGTGVPPVPGAPSNVNSPSVVPAEGGQTSAHIEAQKEEKKSEFKRWEVLFGKTTYGFGIAELGSQNYYGTSQANQSGDWTIGVQFNIWKALGVDFKVGQAVGQSIVFSGPTSTLDYGGGLVFTPFHWEVFNGYELFDLGFTAGYTSVPLTFGGDAYGTSAHDGSYYFGLKGSLNVGKNMALVAEGEELPLVNSSSVTLGVAFKL